MMNANSIQMLCNGSKIAIIWVESDKQYATIIDNFLLKSYSITLDNNMIPLHGAFRGEPIAYQQGMRTIDVDISLTGTNFSMQHSKNLLLDINIFDNYTVTELFKIINKKIGKRKV